MEIGVLHDGGGEARHSRYRVLQGRWRRSRGGSVAPVERQNAGAVRFSPIWKRRFGWCDVGLAPRHDPCDGRVPKRGPVRGSASVGCCREIGQPRCAYVLPHRRWNPVLKYGAACGPRRKRGVVHRVSHAIPSTNLPSVLGLGRLPGSSEGRWRQHRGLSPEGWD